jgi:hypothetical protein
MKASIDQLTDKLLRQVEHYRASAAAGRCVETEFRPEVR